MLTVGHIHPSLHTATEIQIKDKKKACSIQISTTAPATPISKSQIYVNSKNPQESQLTLVSRR